jgi:hypothetical protein
MPRNTPTTRARHAAWLALLLPCAFAAHAQPNADYLRTVFENEHVRVQELFASPGATSPMRAQAPGVRVSVGKARFETTAPDGSVSLVDYNPGQIAWVGQAEERSWKLLAGDAHVFFVEVKSAASGETPPPVPMEPTHAGIVEPVQHLLVLDNEHVRVFDGFGDAGASSATHTHPPSVLVSLAKARFRVTINGKTRIFDFEPATVRWTNHFEHTWQSLSGQARVIMVDIKSAHGDPAFRRRMR